MLKILKSYTLPELKEEVSKTSILKYKMLKKSPLIELMMQHEDKFKHMELRPKRERSELQKANDAKLGQMRKKKEETK